MTHPRDDDSSFQTPSLQGHTPDNTNVYPRPPLTGEQPSDGDAPPIPATESPPLILPPIQGHPRSTPAFGRGPLPARYVDNLSAVVGDRFVLQFGSRGEGSGGGRRRKRTRDEAFGALSSRVVGDYNHIPPPPPPPPELGPFACIMCENKYGSKRSLSRHMRMHNDRDWRGSYPPPTFSMQEFYDDDNARAHLNSPPIDEEDGSRRLVEGPISIRDQMGMELEEGEIIDVDEDEDADGDIRNVGPPPPNLDITKDVNHLEEQYSRVDVLGSSNLKRAELPDLNEEPPPDCD